MKHVFISAAVAALIGVAYYTESSAPKSVFLYEMSEEEIAYMRFISQEGRNTYDRNEFFYRLQVFAENYNKNKAHNELGLGYTLGINQFSDFTHEEYKQVLGLMPRKLQRQAFSQEPVVFEGPSSVDWRTKGAVNDVQNQGQCGSCWAFSATAAIEGALAIKNGELAKLSEQQLVDCDSNSNGCNGGLMDYAFSYVIDNGQESESDYPYAAKNQDCAYDSLAATSEISAY